MSSASPFVAHLDTNYVPSSSEIRALQFLIEDRQKILSVFDEKIEALVKGREEHATFVEKHSALLSPIRRIPNDILSLIFLTCLPTPSSSHKRATKLSNSHPAVIISHVCQRWRELSLNTALLWTVIDIDIPGLPDPRECMLYGEMTWWEGRIEAMDEMTRSWISRSANCPLTVAFTGGLSTETRSHVLEPKALDVAVQKVTSIIDALCDVSIRWRSLYLSLDIENERSAVVRFLQVPTSDVPLLENFAVNVVFLSVNFFGRPSSRSISANLSSGAALLQAASLRRLAIGRLWGSPFSLTVDWASLTEISFGALSDLLPPDVDFPLSLLAKCPNLIRCSVTWPSTAPLDEGTLGPASIDLNTHQVRTSNGEILLPRLQILEIRGTEPPPGLASRLHLPSLRQLTLLCTSPSPIVEAESESVVIGLCRKFGDRLTDVTLDSHYYAESTLTQALRYLTNVVSLRLASSSRRPIYSHLARPVADSLLEELTPKYGSFDGAATGGCVDVCGAYSCPKLERFGCRMNHNVRFSEEACARFIESRRIPWKREKAAPQGTVQHQHNPSPTNFPTPARLESVVLAFPSRKPTKNMRQRLEEMDVDLDGMLLITAYKSANSRAGVVTVDDELGLGLSDHDEYVSTVGRSRQTLDGWTLRNA